MKDIRALKGNFIFSASPKEMKAYYESYAILNCGIVEGIFNELPEKYRGLDIEDFGNKMIIPGFVDLHVHAPQFYMRGLGLDMELIDWLNTYTFPQEAQFSDMEYAKKVYDHFTDDLVKNGTLCAAIFATVHKPATEYLFEKLEKKGILAYVGKVNMDRNSPHGLVEDTKESLMLTEELIQKHQSNSRVKPIITPRFVPSCTEALMKELGKLAQKYNIPVQSHLSENRGEVAWVKELHPEHLNYGSVYNECGLFGQTPALMAHCIYDTDEEIELMSKNGVTAVHCTDSNFNLASGIMPVRKLQRAGIKVGLGSDVGAGHTTSMTRAVVAAIQASKIMNVTNSAYAPLSIEESFYLATKGGGEFFGKVGSFENGYDFNALVIDDSSLGNGNLSLKERLQRFIYIGDDRNIEKRYVQGSLIE